jgi:RNA polymerase II-associated factor 1
MAPPGSRVTNPRDKALLKPLNALGKPASASEQVSFLRRTEYAASSSPQMFASGSSKDLLRLRNDPKRNTKARDKEDPINILKNIVKGFDIAYPQDAHKGEDSAENIRGAAVTTEEIKAWANPKHPTNPQATLLDSYPLLPDLEAIPQMGSYMIMKFHSNPVSSGDKYDTRLDTGIFRPCADPDKEAMYEEKKAEWTPESGRLKPLPDYDYDYYLPGDVDAVPGIKRKLDINDPENDSPELYTDDLGDDQRAFKYPRIRTYETYNQTGDDENVYNDTVAIALHDPETVVGHVSGASKRLAKGAYFYPISTRMQIKPKRRVGMGMIQGEEEKPDELNLTIREPDEEDIGRIRFHQGTLDSSLQTEVAAEE